LTDNKARPEALPLDSAGDSSPDPIFSATLLTTATSLLDACRAKGVMDGAVADFAMSYADQTERDWRLFLEAIKSGQLTAASV